MTYRERREARAERLRGWADKRQTAAAAVFKAGEPFTSDIAFNTQPGHIPFRSRLIAREDRAFESLRKAQGMESRADGIESQLDHAIYSDDPDAIERLTERIAELEAERERIKAVNAAYRKAHGAELKGLSAYQREQKMPHAGYELANLGGNISRQRERLQDLKRKAAIRERAEAAPVESCALCGRDIQAISPTEYVDERNNKASMWPEWHEHTPAPEPARELVVRGVGEGLLGYQTKVAMIRRLLDADTCPPLYLACPCGAMPATVVDGPDVTCTCGAVYSYNGWRRPA